MSSVISIVDSCELFSPPSLEKLCIDYCSLNGSKLLMKKCSGKLKLKKTVILPNHIWEELVQNFDQDSEEYLPMITEIRQKVNLRKLNLSNCSNLLDQNLRTFMQNYPSSLEIHNCPSLTKQTLTIINEFGKDLECLNFGNSAHIIPTDIDSWISKHGEEGATGIRRLAQSVSSFFKGKSTKNSKDEKDKPGMLRTPNLRKLIIWGHYVHQVQNIRGGNNAGQSLVHDDTSENGGGDSATEGQSTVDYWEYLTRDFISNLEYLDLSGCHEVKNLNFLLKANNSLRFLHLHDVLLDYDDMTWGALRNFKELKYLDVSQYNELASVFPNPYIILEGIVTSLPNLVALDISGSNLAGFGTEPSSQSQCVIKGLKSREGNPFQFLGLLASHYNAAGRENIPAKRVTGGATMQQLITALKCYLNRSNMVRKVIRILHEKLQGGPNFTEFIPRYTILDLLAEVIKVHIDDKHTLIISFATMFYALSKLCETPESPQKVLGVTRRDKLLHFTHKAMSIHCHDMSLLRNAILNIHLLSLNMTPMDLPYGSGIPETLLKAARTAVENHSGSPDPISFFLQSVAHLLNNILNTESIKQMTTVDYVSIVCSLINEMFRKNIFGRDNTLFWSLLLNWIGTAKDPDLCARFINSNGIEMSFELIRLGFEDGLSDCAALSEMMVPVIAFLINLVNCPEFESRIICAPYVTQILDILEDQRFRSHKEVTLDSKPRKLLNHVCCGFIVTVASKKSYSLEKPSKAEILDKVFKSIKERSESVSLPIKYRDLQPLYDLLESHNAPEIHLWALWTILILLESADAERIITTLVSDKITLDFLRQLESNWDTVPIPPDRKEEIRRVSDQIKYHLTLEKNN